MKKFASVFVFLGGIGLFGQTSLFDFNGTWEDEESGWWISMHADEHYFKLFKCYDGKTLLCTDFQLVGNTLFADISYSPNQLDTNNIRPYRFDLVGQQKMIVHILSLKNFAKFTYVKISDSYKLEDDCFLE